MFLFDREDADLFEHVAAHKATSTGKIYARICARGDLWNKYPHRIILSRKLGRTLIRSELSDHKNGITTDCRRTNLRLASYGENKANMTGSQKNKFTATFKGVSFYCGKFYTRIQKDKKSTYVGRYDDEIQAALAYDEAAVKIHGEFANLNFPLHKKEDVLCSL